MNDDAFMALTDDQQAILRATPDDLRVVGDEFPIAENWGDWVYVLDRGRFAYQQENDDARGWGYGTYEMSGDQIIWDMLGGGGVAPNEAVSELGEHFVFGWSLYEETVTLTAVAGEISPTPFLAKPWHRASTTPSADAFSNACPPPPEALAEEGTDDSAGFPQGLFEATITANDWADAAIDYDDGPADWGTFAIVVDTETVTVLQPQTGEVGFAGEYTVFRDQVEVSDGVDTVTARWTFDGQQLTFSGISPAKTPFDVVWTSHPWTRATVAESDGAAAVISGIYEWTLTDEDAVRSGPASQQTADALERWFPSTFTVVFDRGTWTLTQTADAEVLSGTYSVFRDRLMIDEVGWPTLTFTFTSDEVGNIAVVPVEPIAEGERFVWTTHQWIRVD